MIVCAALLFCAVATGVLTLWAVWSYEQIAGLERIAEHQDAMRALDPRRPA